MSKKYRFQAQGQSKTIQRWQPPTEKKPRGEWVNWKYFGEWRQAIKHCLLNHEIFPIGKEYREQLENFEQSLEEATQRVIDSLKIGDKL